MAVILFRKDQRPKIHLYKNVAMYSSVNYYGFNGKILERIVFDAMVIFMAGLPRSKCFGNDQFNPMKDRATCHMS